MKARLISVLLVLALLVTVGVIAAQAADSGFDCAYLNCTNTAAVAAQPITNASIGEGLTGGHWYLAENITTTLIIKEGKNCIHLNDHSIIVSDDLAIDVLAGTTLHVNGDDEVVSGNCKDTNKDASTVHGAGEIDFCGGDYRRSGDSTLPIVRSKAVCRTYNPTKLNSDGNLIDLKFSATTALSGGNLGYVVPAKAVDTLNLSGSPKIERLRLYVDSTPAVVQRIKKSDLGSGAEVCVEWSPDTPITSNMAEVTVNSQIKYYTSYLPRKEIVAKVPNNTNLYGATVQIHTVAPNWSSRVCAVCGGEAKEWAPLTANGGALEAGKHYYVSANTTLTAPCTVASGVVCVDLNGYNLTNASGLVFNVAAKATLNVGNSCRLEAVVTGGDANADAATILNAGNLNLYGGTFKHTGVKPTVHTSTGAMTINAGTVLTSDKDVTGGNLYVLSGSVTMNDGIISNGTAEAGGNVYKRDGTFTMNGGEIFGGTATSKDTDSKNYKGGGNILNYAGNLTIKGGTVSGGNATLGGNIFVRLGTITIDDTAVIKNGTAQNGGNLYNRASSTFKIEATVQDGHATGYGGNLYSFGGTVRVGEGAKVLRGSADKSGGNIYTSGGTLRVSGTETYITGGTAASNGGTFYCSATTVQFLSGKFTGGTAGGRGGLMTISSGTVQIGGEFPEVITGTYSGGTFTGGTAGADGGMFDIYAGELKIYDGAFTAAVPETGYTARSGGIFNLRNTGTVTIYGGTFTGGKVDQFGGVAYVYDSGILDIQGGTFNEGTAENEGKTVYARNGEVRLQGGTFNVTSEDTNRAAVYLGGTHDKKDTPDDFSDDVYYLPQLTVGLNGATVVNTNNCTDAISINAWSKLHVLDNYEGTMNVLVIGVHSPYYGETIENTDKANDTQTYADLGVKGTYDNGYSGKLLLSRGDNPAILPDGSGGLVVATVMYDEDEWTTSAADAFENATSSIKLYKDAGEVTINGETVSVDLNGNDIEVKLADGAEKATFNGFNSSTSKAGEAVLNGVANGAVTGWNEAGYFDVVIDRGENTYSYHKVEMEITSVSLRHQSDTNLYQNGLYYTTSVKTDSTLKNDEDVELIFGILVAAETDNSVEGTSYKRGTVDTLKAAATIEPKLYKALGINPVGWTNYGESGELQSDVNSVLISGIFAREKGKDGEFVTDDEGNFVLRDDNAARGEIKVNAVPFISVDGDMAVAQDGARSVSMRDYLEMVEEVVADETFAVTYLERLQTFCGTWGISNFRWNLNKILPAVSNG